MGRQQNFPSENDQNGSRSVSGIPGPKKRIQKRIGLLILEKDFPLEICRGKWQQVEEEKMYREKVAEKEKPNQ